MAQEVYEETVTSGMALGAPDAYLIRDYFSKGILQKRQVQLAKLESESKIEEGVLLIQQIKRRRDIWIRDSLCDIVLERL